MIPLMVNDEENFQDDEITMFEDGSPPPQRQVSYWWCQMFPPCSIIKDVLLYASFAYVLFTGFLHQSSRREIDFFTPVTTNSPLSPQEESLQHTRVAAFSSIRGGAGPVPFCQMPFTLYRTDIRDMICNNENKTFGIIPQSNQKKHQFLHIPKTGGESLEDMLKIRKSHKTWWERRAWYEGNRRNKGLSLTIIRNPFDRMYSWFKFCLHGWKGYLPGPPQQCLKAHHLIHSHEGLHNLTCVSKAFELWIENMFLDPDLSHPWIILPAHDFIGGISPLHVDYIIRFEHYSEDYELLAYALGKNVSLVHDNGSATNDNGRLNGNNKYNLTYDEKVGELLKAPYRDVYTDAAKRMVESHFAIDLITFNYTF